MKKAIYLVLLGSVLTFYSCKTKKEDIPTATINASNGKVVSDNIIVTSGGAKKTGSLPAATGTAGSPVINKPTTNISSLAGKKFSFSPDISSFSANVRGIYFQIVGSGDYFDATIKPQRVSNAKSSRVNTDTSSSVVIELPANIAPGTFCIDYCVYDVTGQVSNTVRVCVTVYQIGGTGSDFLMGKWKMVSYSYDTISINFSSYTDNYYAQTSCASGDSTLYTYWCGPNSTDSCSYYSPDYIQDSVSVSSTNSNIELYTFSDNGGMRDDYTYNSSYAPATYPVCGGSALPVYVNNDSGVDLGGWSYEEGTRRLVMLFDESQYGYVEPYALELTVVSVNGNTMVMYCDGSGGGDKGNYTFEKQP